MKEIIYKDIEKYPLYKAGADGNVYRILKDLSYKVVKGYAKNINIIKLVHNKTPHKRTRASLIAEAFSPNPLNRTRVLHVSNNKLDDRPENLRWASTREIVLHTRDSNRMNHTKINQAIAEEIRVLFETGETCYSELGRMFNVNYNTIRDVIKNLSWRGYQYLSERSPLLSWDIVRVVRKEYKKGKTQQDIATRWDLTAGRVSLIVNMLAL